jgi:predicted dehydrogenase
VAALRDRHFAAAGIDRRDFFVYLYPAARAFVRSVREKQPASPTFSDALAAHALVDAAYRSVTGNGAVEVQLPS